MSVEKLAGIRCLGQVVGRDGFVDRVREWFEAWAREAPRECSTARFPVRAAWPWQYRNYAVELAWQASRELARELAAERDRSATLAAALLRLQRQVARLEVEACDLRRRSLDEWVRVPCTSSACRGRRGGGSGFTVTVQRGEEAAAVCSECLCR